MDTAQARPEDTARATRREILDLTAALRENTKATLALTAALKAMGGRVSPEKGLEAPATPEEERAITERFQQLAEQGDPVTNVPYMWDQLLMEFRTKPGSLQLRLNQADQREGLAKAKKGIMPPRPEPSAASLQRAREWWASQGYKNPPDYVVKQRAREIEAGAA